MITFKFEMGDVVDIIGGNVTNCTVIGRSENGTELTYRLFIPMIEGDKGEHIELTNMHERWLVKRDK